jgi:hypothetical protein
MVVARILSYVLLRPQEKHCPIAVNASRTTLAKRVVLRTKLETHVLMKRHMNVICLQYCSLPLCQWSDLGAPGRSRPVGPCRGPGQVAVAG